MLLAPVFSSAFVIQASLVCATQMPLSPSSAWHAAFADFAAEVVQDWNTSFAIAVVDVDSTEPPAFFNFGPSKPTEETLFPIASNSKAITVASVASLVDRGLLNWTTPIREVLPEFELADPFAASYVTAIDLLSHRTGMPRHDSNLLASSTPEDVVRLLRHLKPSCQLREAWQYNNQMFMTASLLVSRLSGMKFQDYVRQHIFKPLGMTQTTYDPVQDNPEALSPSYLVSPNGTTFEMAYWAKATKTNLDTLAGAGGVVSTTSDLARWVAYLIKATRSARSKESPKDDATEPKVLSPESILKMTTAQSISVGLPEGFFGSVLYGLGLSLTTYRGFDVIAHGGDLPGFQSLISWVPSTGKGVICLTNSSPVGVHAASLLTLRAFDLIHGLEPTQATDALKAEYRKELDWQKGTRTAANAEPPLALSELIGYYEDAGYGRVAICPLPRDATTAELPAACQRLHGLIDTARISSAYQPDTTGHAFLIDFERVFGASHIVAVHDQGDVWYGTLATTIATADGPSPVIDYGEVNGMTIGFRRSGEGVLSMDWRGVWGADKRVETGDPVEVSFIKVSS